MTESYLLVGVFILFLNSVLIYFLKKRNTSYDRYF